MKRTQEDLRLQEVQKKLDEAVKGLTDELKKRDLAFDSSRLNDSYRRSITIGAEYIPIEIRQELGSGRYYTTPKGKIRIQVGGYGSKTQFPERKNGFDFVAIVNNIEERIKATRAARKSEKEKGKRRGSLEEAVVRINEEVGDLSGVRCHADQYLHGIDIEVSHLTEEKALAVMQMLKEILGT